MTFCFGVFGAAYEIASNRKEVKNVVIPSIPLPSAGNVTGSQSGASSVAGKGESGATASEGSGGLFAALLASLTAVQQAAGVGSSNPDASGEEGSTDALANAVADEADATEAVDGATEEPVIVAGATEDVAAVAVASTATTVVAGAAPASVVVASAAPSESSEVAAPPVQQSSSSATVPLAQSGGDVPVVVETPVATNAEGTVNAVRSANVEPTPSAPAPAPVPVDATAPEGTPKPVPQPTQPQAPEQPPTPAPLLTGTKSSASTTLSTPAEPTAQTAPPVLPADARVAASSNEATKQTNDVETFAKSDPDSPDTIGFEQAKPSLSVLRATEASPSTGMREAIEAFAKPAVGSPESVVNVPRPQTPTFVPVTAGDTTSAPIADVSRVAPTVAPAELGAEAPKTVAAPEAPERPTRTTLSDLAQTAVRSVRYLARNGEHRMTLRLVPESLGEVHVEVISTKESLSVRFVSDSAVARDAMEAHSHHLRDSLRQEGLEVRSITVTDDSGSGRGTFNQRDAHASRNGERGQGQSGERPAPDRGSGRNASYVTPRARHEGAFDQVA